MAQVKIVYRLSEAGRRASLLTGGDGRELQVVPVEATPELLALATVRPDGSAWISATDYVTREECGRVGLSAPHVNGDTPISSLVRTFTKGYVTGQASESSQQHARTVYLDAPPVDVVAFALGISRDNDARRAVVQALIDEAERGAAENATHVAAERAEAEAREAAQLAADSAVVAPIVDTWFAGTDEWMEWSGAAPAIKVGTPTRTLTIRALLGEEVADRLRAEDDRREAAAAAAVIAARDAWIRAHGSDRLRKCLDLGLIDTCAGVYRDERLAHDYPGWQVDSKATHQESEIRNPSLEALAALEEARKIDKSATLVKVAPKQDEYDDSPVEWREAVKLDDLPGITSSKVFYRLI